LGKDYVILKEFIQAEMKKECKKCGKCCKYILLWLPHDATKDYIRWIGYHKGMRIVTFRSGINKGFKAIRIDSRCEKLTKDNKCSIYKNRPTECRNYDCWSGLYPKA